MWATCFGYPHFHRLLGEIDQEIEQIFEEWQQTPIPASDDLLWWGHKVYWIADSLPELRTGEALERAVLSGRFQFGSELENFFAGCETPG
jgi:hypothetical protein